MKKIILVMLGLSIALWASFSRDESSQIVTDHQSLLQWQDNEVIQKKWQDAIAYCETLTLGEHDDWRLPNMNELESILDDTKNDPTLSGSFYFYDPDAYWSSTGRIDDSNYAWFICFFLGLEDTRATTTLMSVRCVRAGDI